MKDAEYLFRETERERKRIGYGDKHKKRGGGRFVRLPSDTMSASEMRKRNGGVKTMNINSPVKWAEFKTWPDDIKKTYITLLRQKYGVRTPELADMFGCSTMTVIRESARLGIPAKRGGAKFLKVDAWQAFLLRCGKAAEEQKAENAEHKEEQKQEENPVVVEKGQNIAAIISSLVGTGAKLTIEVVL